MPGRFTNYTCHELTNDKLQFKIVGGILETSGYAVVIAWKKRGNRRTYNTDSETTASTSSDDVRDDITSEKIQMLPTPNSSDKENTPTRPPIVCQ